jgi:hypothetical protein
MKVNNLSKETHKQAHTNIYFYMNTDQNSFLFQIGALRP